MEAKEMENRICANPNCKKPFKPKHVNHIYCDIKCKKHVIYRRKNPIKTIKCGWCGDDFVPENNSYKYCSDVCASEMNNLNAKKRNFKLRREFPEIYYNQLGSKNTSVKHELIKGEDGKPDFDKELDWVKKERKRLRL